MEIEYSCETKWIRYSSLSKITVSQPQKKGTALSDCQLADWVNPAFEAPQVEAQYGFARHPNYFDIAIWGFSCDNDCSGDRYRVKLM
jgi:hypothetical protein